MDIFISKQISGMHCVEHNNISISDKSFAIISNPANIFSSKSEINFHGTKGGREPWERYADGQEGRLCYRRKKGE